MFLQSCRTYDCCTGLKRNLNLTKSNLLMQSRSLVGIALMVVLATTSLPLLLSAAAVTTTGTLSQVSSGLVASDSLTSGGNDYCSASSGGNNDTRNINTGYWNLGGDAEQSGRAWTYCEGSSGLWLSVTAPGDGTWAGIYAESPNEQVMLYHTDLTLPAYTIQNGNNGFNTGLYVQCSVSGASTSCGVINYVTCYGVLYGPDSYQWGAEIATGTATQATNYQQIWSGPILSGPGPSTEDCTIVTNGSNLLYVFMNGTEVYGSTNAGLNMPQPFNAYLEVQSTSSTRLYGQYTDYYSNLNSSVAVTNVPAGNTVELVSGGTVYSSTLNTKGSGATLYLDIAAYDLPLPATLEVLSGGSLVASTSGSFWGGDVYKFTPGSTTTSTSATSSTSQTTSSSGGTSVLHVNSVNTFGQTIDGYYTDLYNSAGSSIATGYTPSTFTLSNGVPYQIEADGYSVCTFSHWQGAGLTGSTADPAPITINSPTTLTAVYSGSSCGPQTINSTSTTSTSSTTTTSSSSSRSTSSLSSTTTSMSSSTSSSSTTTSSSAPPSVTVESVDQNGNIITGYWTVLYGAAGNQIATGYTTKFFNQVTAGTTYQIELDSYGSCTFQHWQGTTNSGDYAFTQPNGPLTVVGVYSCTSTGSLGQAPMLGLLFAGIMSQVGLPLGFVGAGLIAYVIVRGTKLVLRGPATRRSLA
jgi:hypothetical protein